MQSTERERLSAASSAAAEKVAGNDDLLSEILLRVPLKSMVRSKSVCKHWLSLITSPYFSHLISPNPNSLSGLLFHRSSRLFYGDDDCSHSIPKVCYAPLDDIENPATDPTAALAFFKENPNLYVLQSCKGLLCCCDPDLRNFYVVNPTTKQFRTLILPFNNLEFRCFGANLAFDPLKSPHYKVIFIRDAECRLNNYWKFYQIVIYSSETSTWSLSGEPFVMRPSSTVNFSRGVFWNRSINWVSAKGNSLYFNVDRETIQTMPMPIPVQAGGGGRKIRYFGESKDHLHLVEFEASHVMEFKIYEMERDYSGWFVKYCVDLHQVMLVFPEIILRYESDDRCLFSLLRIVRTENDDGSFLVLNICEKVIFYNLEEKTFKKLFDWNFTLLGSEFTRNNRLIRFGWFHAYPYILSLSSV